MARYPIGKQDFKALREGGYLYVDKTRYIAKLLEGSTYYFLSRPRRFGKSLFLSTLEYFFKGERDLFKGLEIDSYPWNWERYPVVHLDLNGANYTQNDALEQRLSAALAFYEDFYDLEKDEHKNISEKLRSLIIRINKKTGKQVVVLIDEYEKPVLDALDHPKISEINKEILRGFYGVLKSLDRNLMFVFLTGITKFGQMNVFSGLNNIRDISLNSEYGAICGVTEEELINVFPEGIEEIKNKRKISREDVLATLKDYYDGYHFSEDCPDIYNPFSLINAFADKEIRAYWASSGTPSLLVSVLKKNRLNLQGLNGVKVDKDRLLEINDRFNDPVSLLYHTGYLTIKDWEWDEIIIFRLGYPNKEVEHSFFSYLLPAYTGRNITETASFMSQFRKYLEEGEPKLAMECLEEFCAGISDDIVPKVEVERHLQYIVYLISRLLLGRKDFVKVEEKTSDGRIDLLIATSRFVYVMEIKLDSSSEEALKQIEDKNYALQYRGDERTVFLIGVNFSTEKRRISGYTIKTPLLNF